MRILWEILYHMYNLSDFRTKTTSEYQGIISFRRLQKAFLGCDDFQTRQIDFGLEKNLRITVCWIDGLVSGSAVTEEILRPLTQVSRAGDPDGSMAMIEQILRGSVYRCAVKARRRLQDLIGDVKVTDYALPGSEELAESVVSTLKGTHACVIPHHGAVFYGPSLEVVLAIAEAVEMRARNILAFDSGL